LLFLAEGRKRILAVALVLLLATFLSTEILLLAYAFMLVVCVLKFLRREQAGQRSGLNLLEKSLVLVLWATLGLLPLVKGSLLLPYAVSVGASAALLAIHRRFVSSLVLAVVPVVSSLALWGVAGQPFANLGAFLKGTALLTSGYTEAMSTSWMVLPPIVGDGFVVAFLLIAAALFFSLARSFHIPIPEKAILALLVGAFLLVAFKHGFVAVMATSSVFSTLAALILILGFLSFDRILAGSLGVAILIAAGTSILRDPVLVEAVHAKFGVGAAWSGGGNSKDILEFCLERAPGGYARTTFLATWDAYYSAWQGLELRLHGRRILDEKFQAANEEIEKQFPLPTLTGTSDMYEDEISALLASDNHWNPRPVFESYSAYTPELARLNEQHLRGPGAPDWIFFRLETIDRRLPSLDDGLSWPALLDNYAASGYAGEFAILHKREQTYSSSKYVQVAERTCKTGESVAVPDSEGLLFAHIDLKPTLAGRLLITFFNPPQLQIVLRLSDGTTRKQRVVAEMMGTGFLMSPFMDSTQEFAAIDSGGSTPVSLSRVQSFTIEPSYGGGMFWHREYELTIEKYVRQ
jgi:hypothetical protein